MTHPRIFGVAGGGLTDATWAVNDAVARVGKFGEERTASLLNRFAVPDQGVTVMHDLRIPIPGFTANIDHLVVSGNTIHLVDAKVWKPAFYWTFGGKTRRGLERFKPAEKRTMGTAVDALTRYLTQQGLRPGFATPILVVWPSSAKQQIRLGWLKVPDARAMTGIAFARYAERAFAPGGLLHGGRGRPADQRLVLALSQLLYTHAASRPPAGAGDVW